jgi:NADH-quinone oxidoreductase subunit M
MLSLLLIFIPVVAGLISFLIHKESQSRLWSLFTALATLIVAICTLCSKQTATNFSMDWIGSLGSQFSLQLNGVSKMLCLLNAISLPIIIISTYNTSYKNTHQFFGLMQLMQAGIMGVFLANDALLFYFFWELALIPAYFLCSIWGGEKRIAVTFKFFIYTFVGSLIMLLGIIYIYLNTAGSHSFSWESFKAVQFSASQQNVLFWVMFIAFAIKMPIFPLHTWQPDAYEQSPTPVTMVLSGVMVKMGVFAVVKWLIPMLPLASVKFANVVMILSVVGMLYASLIAIKQDDVKRLIAYSSIAHIGLMCAALFANNQYATQGVYIQMFSHGINVIGLWIVAELIEKQFGTRKLSELGGIAQKAPTLAILFVILAFANVALPLTNAFVGEFLMFSGLFNYNKIIAAFAGISIILSAVYTLGMVQKVMFGNSNATTENAVEITVAQKLALIIIVALVIFFGFYPSPMLQLINS